MPFGISNIGTTFQRAVDYAFANIKDIFIVIYLDDLTVYSKKATDHLEHLRRVFERCGKFGISLNPNKSFFGIVEGKLLGYIVVAQGVKIDPEKVEATNTISLPKHKKALQSFFGKINFLQRFKPNIVEFTKQITAMLKKDSEIR